MKVACLLENDLAAASRNIQYGKILEIGELLQLIGGKIVGEQIELAVPVASKIDRIVHPGRRGIIASPVRLRYFNDALIGKGELPDIGDGSASVLFPLPELIGEWR